MLKGLFILNCDSFEKIYPSAIRMEIEKLVHILSPHKTRESIELNRSLLNEVDVIFPGSGNG